MKALHEIPYKSLLRTARTYRRKIELLEDEILSLTGDLDRARVDVDTVRRHREELVKTNLDLEQKLDVEQSVTREYKRIASHWEEAVKDCETVQQQQQDRIVVLEATIVEQAVRFAGG